MISPTLQQKQAMERPSAWARDEDLEEGKRMHELKAVRGSTVMSMSCMACSPVCTFACRDLAALLCTEYMPKPG